MYLLLVIDRCLRNLKLSQSHQTKLYGSHAVLPSTSIKSNAFVLVRRKSEGAGCMRVAPLAARVAGAHGGTAHRRVVAGSVALVACGCSVNGTGCRQAAVNDLHRWGRSTPLRRRKNGPPPLPVMAPRRNHWPRHSGFTIYQVFC